MSLLEKSPTPPEERPRSSSALTRRRRQVIAVVVILLLVVTGGALAAVHAFDSAALAQVHVFLDAKPISCADPADVTTVASSENPDDGTYRVPAVKGALGLDCVLSVVIQNESGRDVDLTAITLPYFGPKSGMGIQSDRAQTQQSQPSLENDGRDVVYTWGSNPLIVLGAGDSFTYRIHLTSNGCRAADSTFIDTAPIATVATGTETRVAPLDGAGFGVLGIRTAAQPCRSSADLGEIDQAVSKGCA